FQEGDALNLPFAAATFDASTIAFGLRNLADPVRGLRELLRVVRPGGRAVVLEFVRPPQGVIGSAYRLYLRTLLPAVGGLLLAHRFVDQLTRLGAHAWQRVARGDELRDSPNLRVAERAREQGPNLRPDHAVLRRVDQRQRKRPLPDVEADRLARARAEVNQVI